MLIVHTPQLQALHEESSLPLGADYAARYGMATGRLTFLSHLAWNVSGHSTFILRYAQYLLYSKYGSYTTAIRLVRVPDSRQLQGESCRHSFACHARPPIEYGYKGSSMCQVFRLYIAVVGTIQTRCKMTNRQASLPGSKSSLYTK